MHTFDLRPVDNGFELRGGHLPEPMFFHDIEPRPAVHHKKLGSELRIFTQPARD